MNISCKFLQIGVLARLRLRLLTDSNNVCAECPKMKEKPRMIVANGTRDEMVFPLKISKQMNMMMIIAMQIRTASSFATIESTSYSLKI